MWHLIIAAVLWGFSYVAIKIGLVDGRPVTGDQVSQVFGNDKISEMASQLGMSHGDVSGGLAQILPQLVNHVTPNGQVPQDHNMLQDALSGLFKR